MLLMLAALALAVYAIYRATRGWGAAVLWSLAAAISAINAIGVIAERLWGPRYSWNFAHHGLDSLPGTLISLCFFVGMAFWFRHRHAPHMR